MHYTGLNFIRVMYLFLSYLWEWVPGIFLFYNSLFSLLICSALPPITVGACL